MQYHTFPTEAASLVESAIQAALRQYRSGGTPEWGLDPKRTGESVAIVCDAAVLETLLATNPDMVKVD